MNPLLRLKSLGQSIWYDNIHRELLRSGELERLIREDGICGVTTNPTIFEKAIDGSDAYDASIQSLLRARPGLSEQALFLELALTDVREAADLLRPVHDDTNGRDGLVSLEVSPDLAHDTEGTIAEALRLFHTAERPNVMIKVPATRAGLPAVEALIAEGVNVNVTLLFSIDRYRDVAEAYLLGLESRLRRGQPIGGISSVASFFISRVDTKVDARLTALLQDCDDPARVDGIRSLQGRIAIANAKLAYQAYREIYDGPRFAALREAGARTQRLLWASTGTKNPAYSDVLYVDALIGPETVNTVPPATCAAYKDHGNPRLTLTEDLDGARRALADLQALGIDLAAVTTELETEGVQLFADSYHTLLASLARKKAALS